ncbi:MAG: peptidylprolyl isomerase [Gammaproteobacteria bacterium]|nr:MAG: peptidylprolyl isomerase [Gammaproteobacteria bacterium]
MNIQRDKAVSFTYSIRDLEGNILEQSDLPIGYVHGGHSDLIAKLEQALEGKETGETVDVVLSPEEGFGPHDPNLTVTDDLADVPEQFRHVGAEVEMQNDKGETRIFRVSKIEDGKLTVDSNHPFAGKTIVFHITVGEVRNATPEEIRSGRPADAQHPMIN